MRIANSQALIAQFAWMLTSTNEPVDEDPGFGSQEDCTVVWTETVNEGHTEAGSEDPRPSNPVFCSGARARRTSRLAILPSHHNPLNLISEPLDKKIVGVKTDRIRDGQEKTSRASVSLVSLRLQVRRAPKDEASRQATADSKLKHADARKASLDDHDPPVEELVGQAATNIDGHVVEERTLSMCVFAVGKGQSRNPSSKPDTTKEHWEAKKVRGSRTTEVLVYRSDLSSRGWIPYIQDIWFYEPKRIKWKSNWKDDSNAAAAPASTKHIAEMPAQHASDFKDMADSHSD
ncbi:uncharacterized protein BO96DRAFT_486056 [Aspergillus niger CBS 101883]|uniref:uncharacterized protein n=1 Tax=Aspergillus lacticoffeatus (strain CBS 101883) TaxID=1450533 RepID=UPI000D7FE40D|nr:uncharacterized protein BO96DRAFT_486056 [Aspergillus niger CBS 101883]PYH51747.1 hypothetical protein BO96DRAFT_486056 [Aspergillus niger CBS 101883]